MFRALLIKHWVQLRTLRWVGFGLGIVLPFFLWAGAAAGKRGWFGFQLSSYDLTTLFGEALPAFSMILWCLLAVMFAAQIFAGDRADGTDRFLLERPVPRARTWLARVLASLASSLIVLLGHTLYIAALIALVSDGSGAGHHDKLLIVALVGIGLAVLGTIGGMAAGEMVRTPMQAVLIGGVLAALPVGVAMFLASAFELVSIDRWHLAYFVTPILPIAMILSSYRAGCLGEPAGRGRVRRGVVILVLALVITPLLFAAATPFVLRAIVVGGWPESVAADADRVVVLGGSYQLKGGWMVDTESHKKIRFLPPPVRSSAWKADGSTVAVIHQWGFLGSIGKTRLELIDAAGDTLRSFPLETENHTYARGVQWAGDLVLVREWLGVRQGRIRVIEATGARVGEIVIEGDGLQAWSLLGPIEDGSVYLHRLTGQKPSTFELSRLDLATLRVEEPLLTESDDLPLHAGKFLSPSGRFWARAVYDRKNRGFDSHIIDLRSGTRTDYPGSTILGWLSGDRQLRVDPAADGDRLVVATGAGEELLSRHFENGVSARLSPDARRFLVKQWAFDNGPDWFGGAYGGFRGTAVKHLLVGDGSDWTELDSLIPDLKEDEENVWITWGGPNTLVLSKNGEARSVAHAEPGAEWTPVLGRWD